MAALCAKTWVILLLPENISAAYRTEVSQCHSQVIGRREKQLHVYIYLEEEGREGDKKGRSKGGKEGRRERGREGERETRKGGVKEGRRDRGREGERERGRKRRREGEWEGELDGGREGGMREEGTEGVREGGRE